MKTQILIERTIGKYLWTLLINGESVGEGTSNTYNEACDSAKEVFKHYDNELMEYMD